MYQVSVILNNISLIHFNKKKIDQGFTHSLVFDIKLPNA